MEVLWIIREVSLHNVNDFDIPIHQRFTRNYTTRIYTNLYPIFIKVLTCGCLPFAVLSVSLLTIVLSVVAGLGKSSVYIPARVT